MIEPGTELADKYRVVRLVGEGGMGAVYEAVHGTVGRRVAVKVLHSRYCRSEVAVARFAREARAAAATGHEHIVEVLDFGSHHGMPFIVMEFLQGSTLAARLAHGAPVTVEEACRITGQLLSALASAHATGIVHRDLKPENVFVHPRPGGREHVKIVDFGVSKFTSEAERERTVTEDGTLLGTPAYMSPEQWMGRRDVDHRADLFAVGVLLYEMLTGVYPYEGETRGELFLAVVQGDAQPEAPSAANPAVPPGLDAVVLRAVARDRDARFATAQEFLAALGPYGAEGIVAVSDAPRALPPPGASVAPARRSDVRAATYVEPPEPAPSDAGDDALAVTMAARPSAALGAPGLEGAGVLAAESAALAPPSRRGPAWYRAAALAGVAVALLAGGAALRGRAASEAARARANAQANPTAPRAAASAARATAGAPEPAPEATARAAAPEDEAVTLELQGLSDGSIVRVDGVVHAERPVRLARGDDELRVEVEDRGQVHEVRVRPQRDQVLLVTSLARSTAAPARREGARRGGIGELPVSRRF